MMNFTYNRLANDHTAGVVKKRKYPLILTLIMALIMVPYMFFSQDGADAKTLTSSNAENFFLYVENSDNQLVLLKQMSLSDLEKKMHGNPADNGKNYYFSNTDNLPAACYTEAKGFTVPELIKLANDTRPANIPKVTFEGSDRISLMATDSTNGNYLRHWTYDDLYEPARYYFPGLFSESFGWNSGWEITGDGYDAQSSKAMPLSTYLSKYAAKDQYYENKLQVSASGIKTEPVLAVQSYDARIGSIKEDFNINGSNVTGVFKDEIVTDKALTLAIPQTLDIMMSGNRTMYHNFSWIYNMRLSMSDKPEITPLGKVAAPEANIRINPTNSNELFVDLTCDTDGASIYYTFESGGNPQIKYGGSTIKYDITGRDLSSKPIKVSMRAVKEGYTDAGIATVRYPINAPDFTPIYYGVTATDVEFKATGSVTDNAWSTWVDSITKVSLNSPSGRADVPKSKYRIDKSKKSITFDKSLFTKAGNHSLTVEAVQYANKTLSITMRKKSPHITAGNVYMGDQITINVPDNDFKNSSTVYIKKVDENNSSNVKETYLDKNISGNLIIKKNYYEYNKMAITKPGIYTVILNNSRYEPSEVSCNFEVKPLSEKPVGKFEYSLVPDRAEVQSGELVKLNIGLNSEVDNFPFYAGEYRIEFTSSTLLKGIESKNGWEFELNKEENGKKTVTFVKLDMSGDGIMTKGKSDVGSIQISSNSPGTFTYAPVSAILTDKDANERGGVTMHSAKVNFKVKPISPAKYTVTFSGNGGKIGKSSVYSKVVTKGGTFRNLPVPSRRGYKFAGWYTAKKGGTRLYDNSKIEISRNTTYYAKWTAKKYKVTFNANGKKVKKIRPKKKTVTYAKKFGKLPKPKRKGYKFKGWYTAKKGGKKITSKTKVNIKKNTVLYSRWERK